MNKKEIKFSNRVNEEEIYLSLTKSYQRSITDFFEFERSWLYRAYDIFKDFDKYLILVHFFKETFKSYSDIFIKKTFNEFYDQNSFEIVKLNIIDVSRELMISKETTRRKILELEKDNIIKKNKKAITFNRKALNLQKPDDSVYALSRFLSNFSKILHKNRFIKNVISTKEFEAIIKNNFTLCWLFFLEFQIPYVLKRKNVFFNDLETFFIVAILVNNQNLNLNKFTIQHNKNYYKSNYFKLLLTLGEKKGLNAMSISDLTGIPRPTVLRKINNLLKNSIIQKDNFNMYATTNKYDILRNLESLRIENIKNLSTMISKFYNLVKN